MSQNPSSIGNPFAPVVNGKELRQIILHQGQSVIWKNKGEKCSTGWAYGNHDPDCGTCGSKSGYVFTDRKRKVFLLQRDAHAGYNAENLSTVIGVNERADYEMYTEFHVGRIMKKDDLIIYDRRYGMDLYEFTIMTKKEIMGTFGHKIGWRILLFKSPKKDTLEEVPFRTT